MRKLAILCCLAMLVASGLSAQSANATRATEPATSALTEKVEVSVINVDVTVTGPGGTPVTGLTRDDFEVLEDGEPQAVTNFYAIEDAVVRLSAAGAGTPDPENGNFRRKIVLLVDNNFIDKTRRDAALGWIERFIDDHFAGNYEWSVATVGRRAETLQSFTDQKALIHAALDRVRSSPVFELRQRIDRRILDNAHDRLTRDVDSSGEDDFTISVRFQAREQTLRNYQATLNSARAVVQTCRAYSAEHGKKLILLVTGGMESNTGFDQYDSDSDPDLAELKQDIGQVLDTMVREANAANFNIYVVNARGRGNQAPQHDIANRSSGTGGALANLNQSQGFNRSIDTSDTDSAALTLALGTGGQYLAGNDVKESLRELDEDSANFYSLGYAPRHSGDGKYHRIKVRVKRPGVSVRHRAGYLDLSTEARFEQALRAPMTFPKEKGTLPVSLDLGIPDRSKAGPSVPVTAAMPVGKITFFPREGNYVGRVHVYLSIYDGEGVNIGFSHEVQDIAIPAESYAAGIREPFRYTMKVALGKGDYTLLVTLRDDISNEIGSAFKDIRI